MTAEQLLADLALSEIALFLDGNRLRYRAPVGALTPELRDRIGANRLEIIERLRMAATTTAAARRCGNCDRHNWQDDPPKDGRIRTTCGKCGRFIGYRPAGPRMA